MIPILDHKPIALSDHRSRTAPLSTASDNRFCLACDQSLLGVTLRRCPECGRAFDPEDPSTTTPHPRIPLGLKAAAALRRVNKVWVIALMVLFALCFTGSIDMIVLMMLVALALLPALITVALSAMPFVRLAWPSRLAGLLLPVLFLATCMTYWPFFLAFQSHRPLFDSAADRVAKNGPHGPGFVGIIHYREAEVRFGTNVGFQITGGPGSGYYVVRADPSQPSIWLSASSDLPLGDNWHLIWED